MQIHVPSMSNFAHSDTLTQTYRWPWFPSGPRKTRSTSSTLKDKHTPFLSWFHKVCGWLFLFFNQSLCTVMEQTQVEPIGNSRYTHCMVTWRAMLCKDAYLIPLVPHLSWLAPLSGFTLDFIVSNRDITQHCTAAITWRNHKQKKRHTLYRGCLMHQHYQNLVW